MISIDFINNWDQELERMNELKPGRKFKYPESFIRWAALAYHTMNLPYRTLQGFIRSFAAIVPKLEVADYTTLFRRITACDIKLSDTVPPRYGNVVIALDSSGITLSNSGEWMRKKWRGNLKHRGWIKVHIAVDVDKNELVGVEVTDHRTNDDKMFKKLMKQCKENLPGVKIKKVLADGAYDRKFIFNYLKYHNIESGIKMRKDATAMREGYSYRSKCVWHRNKIGHDAWKRETGYTKRWNVEAVFSSVKRMFRESVRAKTPLTAMTDSYRKMVFYNALFNYGRGRITGI